MKRTILYIACMLLWCTSLTASDTLRLPNMEPLVIWGTKSQSVFERMTNPHSHWSASGWDLGKALDRMGLAQVNSTGVMGASSTIRCRGLASDHTVITWHGMSLNAPTLGTADASLIPLSLFGQCRIMYQPNLMQSAAQGLGATIEISEEDEESVASARMGVNSLNNANISFQAVLTPGHETHSKAWRQRYHVGAYTQRWHNDFKYQDPWMIGSPWMTQHHNNGQSSGGVLNWKAEQGPHRLSAHGWYVQRDTRLPATMGTDRPGTAEQADRQIRGVAEYVYKGKDLWLRGALRSQEFVQSYDDLGIWEIHSRMRAQSHQAALEATMAFGDLWQLGGQTQFVQQSARSNDYADSGASLPQYAAAFGVKRMSDHAHIHADVRIDHRLNQSYWSGTFVHSLFYNVRDWQCETRGNAGRRVRLPDLNELFWNPGGNRWLAPEEAWTGYLGQGVSRRNDRFSIELAGGATFSDVRNWIQWTPDSTGLWSAQNVSHVRSFQPEMTAHLQYHCSDSMHVALRGNVQYNSCSRITEDDESYQMIYTPAVQWGCSVDLGWKHWLLSCATRYQSMRFTDEQNEEAYALDPQYLVHLLLSYTCPWRKSMCSFALGVDNLTNISYQSVRGYPMPGRVFEISCQINLPHHEKQLP